MIGSSLLSPIYDVLARDVTLWGSIQSPVLSLAGAAGIVAFCTWHLYRLFRQVSAARAAHARMQPGLSTLAEDRRQHQQEWLTIRALADSQTSRQPNPRPARIDLDDIHALDALLRQEPLYQRAWMQFRKTYVLEQTSWFVEPRVFSTKPAADFFAPENLLSGKLNLSFYQQLPSLLTGIGLLFTFLAILIGLSRLHAEGSQIVGIQGLINGLAGKFLTSVVGLVCANLFVMLEKSWSYMLTRSHQRFITVLDELFPRLTMEQLLENRVTAAPTTSVAAMPHQEDLAQLVGGTITDRLGPSLSALTSAVQSFAQRTQRDASSGQPRTAADVAKGVREGLATPLQDLQRAITELTRSVGDFRTAQGRAQQQLEDLAGRLTVDLSRLGEALDRGEPQGIGSGLRWFAGIRQRAVAKSSV